MTSRTLSKMAITPIALRLTVALALTLAFVSTISTSAFTADAFIIPSHKSKHATTTTTTTTTTALNAGRIQPPSTAGGITSNLISQLAVIALKLRLKDQTQVECDVTMDPVQFLRGNVGPVTVKGRGWRSSLNLTCRAIEATVETCELDFGRILAKQKIVLTKEANGKALIAMTGTDFGNFITHPLLRPPRASGKGQLVFLKDGAFVDAQRNAIRFFGDYEGQKWKFSLQRGTTPGNAVVQAELQEDAASSATTSVAETRPEDVMVLTSELSELVATFFNQMEFELDGTFLKFDDLMITSKGQEPSVMLALKIRVVKFPSAGIEF